MPDTPSPIIADDAAAQAPIMLRIPDAVRMSGLSRSGLYRAWHAGDIALVKAGTSTLVDGASLRAYLARLPRIQPRGAGQRPDLAA